MRLSYVPLLTVYFAYGAVCTENFIRID